MKAYGGVDSDESDQELEEVNVDKLPPLEIGPDEHKLQYTYCLWYHRGLKVKASVRNPILAQLAQLEFELNYNSLFCFSL